MKKEFLETRIPCSLNGTARRFLDDEEGASGVRQMKEERNSYANYGGSGGIRDSYVFSIPNKSLEKWISSIEVMLPYFLSSRMDS